RSNVNVHDQCYSNSMQPDECWPIFDNPYTEHYFYDCKNHEVTCSGQNNKCERFICECDRKVECFARDAHKYLTKFYCLDFFVEGREHRGSN
uniref:Phospholipase A2-like central domain-containing protein n=1 Tax=Gadus morhua TaxID=8049 RepID=A0A8C4YXV2_GADMO